MSTIKPTTSTASLPSSPSTSTVATVQGTPPVLGRAAVGQVLEATIISQTAKNTFQVQTPLGKFLTNKSRSPVKFFRDRVKEVAARLPLGTGIICLLCESRLLNMGMEAEISGPIFWVSIR